MGVLINHIVSGLTEPIFVTLLLVAAGVACCLGKWRKTGIGLLLGAVVWLWFFSSGLMVCIVGRHLESMYPPVPVERVEQADAIVVLGGGMGGDTNVCPYAEMWSSADRVWHAARLYKAGKAPKVIISGRQVGNPTLELLVDFGVPEDAIVTEAESGNTEENAKFVMDLLRGGGDGADADSSGYKVLLVTSAWHMRRAMWNFRKASFEVIPAPADYEATLTTENVHWYELMVPNAASASRNGYAWKEIVGYWGYRLMGR